ncbi:MAG: DUF2892 domain-containing protein [Thermoanaerobaculia bacterium]
MAVPNESRLDRIARLLVGVLILAVGWLGPVDDLPGVACRILGWYPLVTGILGWSPLYAMLGLSTRGRVRPPR